MKKHLSIFGVIICIVGILIAVRALMNPVSMSVNVGDISTTKYYVSIYSLIASCVLLIVGGAILTIKNEARGFFDRESLLNAFGLKRKK